MFDVSKINYLAKTNIKSIQTDTMSVCQTMPILSNMLLFAKIVHFDNRIVYHETIESAVVVKCAIELICPSANKIKVAQV